MTDREADNSMTNERTNEREVNSSKRNSDAPSRPSSSIVGLGHAAATGPIVGLSDLSPAATPVSSQLISVNVGLEQRKPPGLLKWQKLGEDESYSESALLSGE